MNISVRGHYVGTPRMPNYSISTPLLVWYTNGYQQFHEHSLVVPVLSPSIYLRCYYQCLLYLLYLMSVAISTQGSYLGSLVYRQQVLSVDNTFELNLVPSNSLLLLVLSCYSTETSPNNSHSHLASIASVEPTIVVPPPTPAPQIYMRVKDIPANPPPGSSVRSENQGRIFYQPLTHMHLKQNAQTFTGAPKQRGNTYPHVNAARDLADRIGVTKNPLNLKKLETITEKRYSDKIGRAHV